MTSERSNASSIFHTNKIQLTKYQSILIDRFKAPVIRDGVESLIGLRKTFKDMDRNEDGALNYLEFENAVVSFGLDLP